MPTYCAEFESTEHLECTHTAHLQYMSTEWLVVVCPIFRNHSGILVDPRLECT